MNFKIQPKAYITPYKRYTKTFAFPRGPEVCQKPTKMALCNTHLHYKIFVEITLGCKVCVRERSLMLHSIAC